MTESSFYQILDINLNMTLARMLDLTMNMILDMTLNIILYMTLVLASAMSHGPVYGRRYD